jgi:hypothetical protein
MERSEIRGQILKTLPAFRFAPCGLPMLVGYYNVNVIA